MGMKNTFWFLFFLPLLIPSGISAQTQDVHALSIVTQTFDKAKKDNKTRQDNAVLKKTHRIENLNPDGNFKSVEKQMIYRAYTKETNKGPEYVEKLVDIWPPKSEPAPNFLDFEELLDAFLSRFYFSVDPEKETIGGRSHLKINFWPRADSSSPQEPADYLINHIVGILYIDEQTFALRKISGSLGSVINERPYYVGYFHMDMFNFNIEISDWGGLELITRMDAIARYEYRDPRKNIWSLFGAGTVRRYQTHQFWYKYGTE